MTRAPPGETFLTRWSRRALTIPVYFVLAALALATAPLWIPIAWLADRRRSDRSALACLAFATFYLLCEITGVLASFAIWVTTPPLSQAARDRFLQRNQRLQTWWASRLLSAAQRLFGFRFEIEGSEALAAGPMLLLLRHASIADTLIAATQVSAPFGVQLRYVLKSELLWDPCLDIVGNRLPNYFVRRDTNSAAASKREVQGVVSLLDGLGDDEGVLIYPEGTRFTEAKRARAIERLRERGQDELADRAAGLERVLLPRPAGTLALLEANPGLDVVLCAHTGLEATGSIADLWYGALRNVRARVAFWRVPFADLPKTADERREWLFQWWERIDQWIRAGDAGEGRG